MFRTDKFRWALIVMEVTLWALAAAYIAFSGLSWHLSGAAASAAAVRSLRKKYCSEPPRNEQPTSRGLGRDT